MEKDATPVLTLTLDLPPPTTHPVLLQVPPHETVWQTTPGWEAPLVPWDHSWWLVTRSWMSRLRPGGQQVASWAYRPVKETQVLKPSWILLEKRGKIKMGLLSSFFQFPPTSAGTNPNLETHLCSGSKVSWRFYGITACADHKSFFKTPKFFCCCLDVKTSWRSITNNIYQIKLLTLN